VINEKNYIQRFKNRLFQRRTRTAGTDAVNKKKETEIKHQSPETRDNRYARDWDAYSKIWDGEFGGQYEFLGDEWNDDGSQERKRDDFYFKVYAERFISSEMSVLEIGPGGGKWTARIAPSVKKMFVIDVSEEMLNRTRKRCESLNIKNVEYIIANGKDFHPVPDESIDFFFSYDVFVHIALEDTWPYTQEMARVLVPGGRGVCHYAINSTPEAWNRIDQHNDWYRFAGHTLGQFYYYSPESLRRMYERCGLVVSDQYLEKFYCTCMFSKPKAAVIPTLELLLKELVGNSADDETYRMEIIAKLTTLPEILQKNIKEIIRYAENESDFQKRMKVADEIRRIWRGI
jgi:ubiquinone/menaquinone biosynthesis C-methylase UbiE